MTVHGKGTFVAQMDKGLAEEARRKAVEEEFAKAVDKAKMIGMNREEIMQTMELLLEE